MILFSRLIGDQKHRAMVTAINDELNNRTIVIEYDAPESDYDEFLETVGSIINSVMFTKIAEDVSLENSNLGNNSTLSSSPSVTSNIVSNESQVANNVNPTNMYSEKRIFQSPANGLSFSYPSDWAIDDMETENGGSNDTVQQPIFYLYSPEYYDVNEPYMVSIDGFVDDLSSPDRTKNLSVYMYEAIDSYKDSPELYPGFELLTSELNDTLSGQPAHSLTLMYNDLIIGKMIVKEIGTVMDEKAFSFRISAIPSQYQKFLPVFISVVESVDIQPKS